MGKLSGHSSRTAIRMGAPQTAAAGAVEPSAMRQETAADVGGRSYAGPAAASEAQRRVQLFLTALMSAESFDKHTLQVRQVGRRVLRTPRPIHFGPVEKVQPVWM
jgi:hypothetical protein